MPKSKKPPTSQIPDGGTVAVDCGEEKYEGILLPRHDSQDFITLKLPSGYNVGIARSRIKRMEALAPQPEAKKAPAEPAPHHAKSSGFLSILGCGGTIASKIDYRTGAVDAAVSPQELVSSFSHLSKMELRAKSLFFISSEDTSPAHWAKLAEEAAAEIKSGSQGVVITHGTDTMSYTSSALSFMLQNLPCPIVLTGSQRSSDRGSSDAEQNMRASLLAAQSDLSGVFICMHEDSSDNSCLLHFGTKVRKMHTSRRDAFHSISCLPAARAFPLQGKIETISSRTQKRNPASKLSLDTRMNENVALLYTYPGMKPAVISSLSKYDGIVIAGSGLGHMPCNTGNDPLAKPVFPEVKALIDSGIPVVMAPQTIYGRINLSVYSTGRRELEAGIIGNLCDFTPETAYVKLMWVLGREKKMEKVKALMERNIAGEITERSEIADY